MKILWIVNIILPYPSAKLGKKPNVFGGWMNALMNSLIQNNDVKLAVAATYNGNKMLKFSDGKIVYYLIPCKNNYKYDNKLEKFWKDVSNDFLPDIVHLHGTEFAHGLSFLNACPNIKSVASIQGLVSLYGELYLLNISHKDIIHNISLRDIIRFDNMYQASNKFLKRGENEIKILRKVNKIIGRTSWDYSAVMALTEISKYCRCNESLRDTFYNKNWEYKKVEKNTIFVSQASYPIKGFHEIIKALPIIKKFYPDVKIYVAGQNIIDTSSIKNRLKLSGYGKYLIKLMKKYDVSKNIEFVGLLNEQQMVEKMLKCNVFVQTSIIENSPNSLGEAMLLGMPIVASNVGGTSDMLIDKKEGYLYPYAEQSLLAKYIIDVFNKSEKAKEIGDNAKLHALKTHNRDKNAKNMISIYRSLIDENKK